VLTEQIRIPVEEMLTIACRAPSIQNSQPWLWRWDGQELQLLADFSRQLMHTDPAGRDLAMSCGAALHHLQVAAAGLGWRTEVRRLPAPTDRHRLATIAFTTDQARPEAHHLLLAIQARQTDRRPMAGSRLPDRGPRAAG
jgi:hypothetical protein